MEPWKTAVVGIVQGLTEFLPVSSSAHIVFAERLLHLNGQGLELTVIVHFGTLVAVVVAMWYRIVPIVQGTLGGVVKLTHGASPWDDEHFRWGAFIVLATIPAAVVGVMFERQVSAAFGDPRMVSGLLLVTGTLLFTTRFAPQPGRDLRWWSALAVGLAQAVAILPGISRSGSTIATGLFCGIDRRKAVEFSFLLSIPIILGPSLLTIGEIVARFQAANAVPLAVGCVVSGMTGYVAVRLLIGFVQRRGLTWFAYYCWAVGLVGLLIF